MPSLKDLRNRISSVKATRKITKAMQMVAAAKLRRAQEAAVAGRPYAQRMDAILANLNASLASREGASPLLVGTGSEQVHLLVVMTAERGLAGAFNSGISRLARQRIQRLRADGKEVKILCVGRKGADALRREYGKMIVGTVDLRSVRQLGYVNAMDIAKRILKMFEKGEFDVATLFFSEFKNVITQQPKAMQLVPARLPEAAKADDSEAHADLRVRAGGGRDPQRSAAAQYRNADLQRPPRKRGWVLCRADDRDGQCDAQCRRHDRPPDAALQPHPPGDDHQGTDRNHFGRRGALTR